MDFSEVSFDDVFDHVGMYPEMFEFTCVDESELLIFHEFYKGPEGFRSSLDMVEKVCRYQVHALNITDFTVINAVGY